MCNEYSKSKSPPLLSEVHISFIGVGEKPLITYTICNKPIYCESSFVGQNVFGIIMEEGGVEIV